MDPELPEGRLRPAQAGLIRTRLSTETAPSPTGHFWWHTLSQHSIWPQGTSRRRGTACVQLSKLPRVCGVLIGLPWVEETHPGRWSAHQTGSVPGPTVPPRPSQLQALQGLPRQGLGSLGHLQPGQGGRGCPKPRLKPVAAVPCVCFFSIKLHGRRAVSRAPCSGVRLEFSATL